MLVRPIGRWRDVETAVLVCDRSPPEREAFVFGAVATFETSVSHRCAPTGRDGCAAV